MLVDTHVHVVASDLERYPLAPLRPDETWFREAPCSAERFAVLMDDHGVDRAVLVQTMSAYGDDNRYVVDAANDDPRRFASVVYVDLAADPVARLDEWWARDIDGVRVVTGTPNSPVGIADDTARAVLRRADDLGLGIVVTVVPDEMPGLRALLAELPGLRVALDHCGFPDLTGGHPWPGAADLLALAALPHVLVKVSSIVLHRALEADGDPRPFVEHLAEHFGADRLLWASNHSHTRGRSYGELVDLARHACSRFSSEDARRFLGENALELWPPRTRAGTNRSA